jgi:hypothetical protein
MNKPVKRFARPLWDLVPGCVGQVFARQGFASIELVTHWADIVGQEVAALAEPLKISWPRRADRGDAEPATLILRVEGPAAIEIQHLAPVILAQVNRFLGWRAVGRISLRQAPLVRPAAPRQAPVPTREETEQVRQRLTGVDDGHLREALARLGAAVNQTGRIERDNA